MSVPYRLTLEFDPGSEPIGGWLVAAAGQRYAFAGWLELIAQIEAALTQPAANPGADDGER